MHHCRWSKPIRTENSHEARTESWKLPSVSHVTPLWIEGRPSRVIGENLEGRVEAMGMEILHILIINMLI